VDGKRYHVREEGCRWAGGRWRGEGRKREKGNAKGRYRKIGGMGGG